MSIFICIGNTVPAAANDLFQRLALNRDSEALLFEAGFYFVTTRVIQLFSLPGTR